ncbi:DUF1847 domain-containing protein [bacterium]|nr:DUF1847 domain-containing protein [bacterium]
MYNPQCAKCYQKYCYQGIMDESKLPSFCPLRNSKELIQKVKQNYQNEKTQNFYLLSSLIEKEAYDEKAAREEGKSIPVRPRIREIVEFGKKLGSTKIGVAFCIGVSDEAARASSILENHGFEVCSVACSCGGLDKSELGVPPHYKIKDPRKYESACNPLLQAELLNQSQTDFNVLLGLCVGHDMLFTMNSEAPVTTLLVKDRFTGHNPVISLYTRYHRHLV